MRCILLLRHTRHDDIRSSPPSAETGHTSQAEPFAVAVTCCGPSFLWPFAAATTRHAGPAAALYGAAPDGTATRGAKL